MKPLDKRERLRRVVESKGRWSRRLTAEESALGFLGWHERGYLPHCDFPGLTQFVTFRLADSMPAARRTEWEAFLKMTDNREKRRALESYLDRGAGHCWLRHHDVAGVVMDTLTHFHGEKYDLLAWVVMPNHVHVLLQVHRTPLARIVQSWKSFVTRWINRALGRAGRLWEPEYWDTCVASERHRNACIRYIERNPVKAGLCGELQEFEFSSARYRDLAGRLALSAVDGLPAPPERGAPAPPA